MKKVIKKLAGLIGAILAFMTLVIVLFILVKGWELRNPLKEGVSAFVGVAQQALKRLEGSTVRLRAPVDQALGTLDQLDTAVREWGGRLESERPLLDPILKKLNDRFSEEVEAGFQTASAVGEAILVINKSLETINRFSRVKVPTLTDELAQVAEQFREMKGRLQELRDTVEGLKTGVLAVGVEAVLSRIQWFRPPLARIQKALIGAENRLDAKRRDLMELEGNLLFNIDLGVLALTLFCPLLAVGQVCWMRASWRLFRGKGRREG